MGAVRAALAAADRDGSNSNSGVTYAGLRPFWHEHEFVAAANVVEL